MAPIHTLRLANHEMLCVHHTTEILFPTSSNATHAIRSDGVELGSCAEMSGRSLKAMNDDDDINLILNIFVVVVKNRNTQICSITTEAAAEHGNQSGVEQSNTGDTYRGCATGSRNVKRGTSSWIADFL